MENFRLRSKDAELEKLPRGRAAPYEERGLCPTEWSGPGASGIFSADVTGAVASGEASMGKTEMGRMDDPLVPSARGPERISRHQSWLVVSSYASNRETLSVCRVIRWSPEPSFRTSQQRHAPSPTARRARRGHLTVEA